MRRSKGIKQNYDEDGFLNVRSTIKSLNLSRSANDASVVGIGGTVTVSIFAPAGFELEVKLVDITVNPPPAGTAGTHTWSVFNSSGVRGLTATGLFSDSIAIRYGHWLPLTLTVEPVSEIAQQEIQKTLYATAGESLDFAYSNNTDVVQTNIREIDIALKQVSV